MKFVFCFALLGVLSLSTAHAHCQIPCGIYGDQRVFEELEENIQTVAKSMKTIVELSVDPGKNINQLVRWVNNKDVHANKIMETVLNYFLAQRVKIPETDDAGAMSVYYRKLAILHQIVVHSMKAKQTTDLKNVEKLSALLGEFEDIYFTPEEKAHLKEHDHRH